MFKNPFSFEGRIRRTEYGLSIILMFIGAFIIGVIIGATGVAEGIMNVVSFR
jgi:uncharacterized membrane protein YhaH (DUF805 family)